MNYAKDIASNYTASYAKYVATSRAIPRLVDGLKPVQRRCINSADDLKLYHDRKFLKVAKLEGQVMGDYHPHGGASMTILAQPFKTRYPLFEGQGNWGSPDDPNSVAASRYIETRMTKFCEDFYLESAEYADKEPNYDGRLQEVVQYYPPIPGVLLTGSSGIAVGLSTNIPPHRVSDVCRSMLYYINGGGDCVAALMPETCEESIILTPKAEIEKLYRTGEGSIQYKAKTHYESIDGKLALVVDAFPPEYSKKRLETSFILEAVEAGNLELRNESSTDIRYVFLSNDKAVLEAVEDRLVSSSGYRLYIEHEDKIHLYTIHELYNDFIRAREKYIVRKYTDIISKNEVDLEYIRVLLALKSDKDYLKSMFDKSPKEVTEEMVLRYTTTTETARRVISSSLTSLMKDNAEALLAKMETLKEQVEEYQDYVNHPLCKVVKDIDEIYQQYKNEERRATHIDDIRDLIDIEYCGTTLTARPSDVFYVATKDNQYEAVHAAELLDMDLSNKLVVSANCKYYVFYDMQGLVVVTADVMSRMDNKFKSDSLEGLLGTDDLSTINLHRSNTKKVIPLGDWAIRTRASYVKQVEDPYYISLVVQG